MSFSNFYIATRHHRFVYSLGVVLAIALAALCGYGAFAHGFSVWVSCFLAGYLTAHFSIGWWPNYLGLKHRFVSSRWEQMFDLLEKELGGRLDFSDWLTLAKEEEYLDSVVFLEMDGFLGDMVEAGVGIGFICRVLDSLTAPYPYAQAIHAHLHVLDLHQKGVIWTAGSIRLRRALHLSMWLARIEYFMQRRKIKPLELWIDDV